LPLGHFSYITYLAYDDPVRLIFVPKAETCISISHSFVFFTKPLFSDFSSSDAVRRSVQEEFEVHEVQAEGARLSGA
jgi:hypothetical protein